MRPLSTTSLGYPAKRRRYCPRRPSGGAASPPFQPWSIARPDPDPKSAACASEGSGPWIGGAAAPKLPPERVSGAGMSWESLTRTPGQDGDHVRSAENLETRNSSDESSELHLLSAGKGALGTPRPLHWARALGWSWRSGLLRSLRSLRSTPSTAGGRGWW